VSANYVGARRIAAVLKEKGWASLGPLGHELIDRTEAAMRKAIATLRPGVYRAEAAVDRYQGEPIVIRVAVEVRGDHIVIDYDGTSSQIDRAYNVVFNYTNAHSIFAVKCMVARQLPNNAGCVRPITVRAPLGCILNAEFPVSVAQRAQIGHVLPDVIFQAMAPAAPDGVLAGSGSNPLWSNFISGMFDDSRRFMLYAAVLGGLGGRSGADGVSCLGFPANVSNTPIEVLESEAPVICEQKTLATDSAGPGRFRGGLGQDFTMRFRRGPGGAKGRIIATLRGGHFEFPVAGILGGGAARNGGIVVNGVPLDSSKQVVLEPGDSVTFQTPGGGGFGPASQRDPALIRRDLEEGYVSEKAARDHYGYAGPNEQ
jgi:N-methylhydantoinase B